MTTQFTAFAGIDNVSPSEQRAENFLAAALDVVVTAKGAIAPRGALEVVRVVDADAVYQDSIGVLYLSGGTLYAATSDTTSIPIYTGITAPASFCTLAMDTFIGSKEGLFRVRPDRSVKKITDITNGISVSNIAGSIVKGDYLVACTIVAKDGEESAPSLITPVNCTGGLLLNFTGGAAGERRRIYMSQLGGTELFQVHEQAATIATANLTAVGYGVALDVYGKTAPSGDIAVLEDFGGSLMVAANQFLWYSRPYRFEYFDSIRQVIPFPEQITCLVATNSGVWVSTKNKLYFMQGSDLETCNLTQQGDFGLLRGSAVKASSNLLGGVSGISAIALSDFGLVQLSDEGTATLKTQNYYHPLDADYAVATISYENGYPQYFATLFTN